MDKNKLYIYANELTLNTVTIVYNNGMCDKEVTLGTLLENYKSYHIIINEVNYLKDIIANFKDDLDKLVIE